MPTHHYHKIVRDKVPELIKKSGAKPITRVMPVDDFARMLREKLVEEAREVKGAKAYDSIVGELADVMEVVASIQKILGISSQALSAARRKKFKERGGFTKRILLESVDE